MRQEKESDNEESDNESSDGIVPPTDNHPVKLRLHNRWPSVFPVADNMIRTPVLYTQKGAIPDRWWKNFLTGIIVWWVRKVNYTL